MGVTGNVGYGNRKYGNVNYESLTYGGGGFIRMYKKINDNLYFFGHGGTTFDFTNSTMAYSYYVPTPSSSKAFMNSSFIKPGITYFITPKIGIDATFGNLYIDYRKETFDNGYENKSISSGLNLNLSSFGLGVNFYL